MELDFGRRELKISVGELADFALRPHFGGGAPGGAWRTAVGRQWHQDLQEASLAGAAEGSVQVAAEVAIEALWPLGGWTARISGRIDEVHTSGSAHRFREIKTVRRELPADPAELRAAYPAYFAQLAIYLELAGCLSLWNDRPREGELLLVDIDEGVSQTVPLDPGESAFRLRQQLEQLERFLILRTTARENHSTRPPKPPFERWRPGQEAAATALEEAGTRGHITLFEGPTGFGKTGLALAHGLAQLRSGRFDRLILLTGKSSGQAPLMAQLRTMLGKGDGLRYLQMRNRLELSLAAAGPEIFDRTAMAARWEESGLTLEDLFDGPTALPERLVSIGERHALDPHALARSLLPLADLWVGDYNYLFSPGTAGVFRDVSGFQPARTFLIVDEAHNLAPRAAAAWSHQFDAAEWHLLASELDRRQWPPACVRQAGALAAFLDTCRASERLSDEAHFEGQGLLRELAREVLHTPLPWEEADDFTVERLWQAAAALATFENPLLPLLSWAPGAGRWALTCLDASAMTGPFLQSFGGCLLMSATLSPREEFAARLGLPAPGSREARGSLVWVSGEAPWREGAHRVAIDARVDTRFAQRDRSLRTTAQTVQALAEHEKPPLAVFFSSYRYAGEVARLLEWECPHLRLALQPRGLDLQGQTAFIEEALLTADAVFLILGSSFSEGIDALGGRVACAMVVGPALPEVNPVQEATREAYRRAAHPDPFRAAYQIPGLTRIHQALGRLVRAPGQRARILLHGKRFAQPAYHELLRPEFQTRTILRDDSDLAAWLQQR